MKAFNQLAFWTSVESEDTERLYELLSGADDAPPCKIDATNSYGEVSLR
jgi:hypothetical protein